MVLGTNFFFPSEWGEVEVTGTPVTWGGTAHLRIHM